MFSGALSSLAPSPSAEVRSNPRDVWKEIPPPVRAEHVAVYDQVRRQLVVFGGRMGRRAYSNDVWVLSADGQARWERLVAAGEPPSPRVGAAAVLDPSRDRILIFGGRDVAGMYLNDLWELSFRGRPAWSLIRTAIGSPSGRYHHTLTLDPERDRLLMFGGWDGSPKNDLWQLLLEEMTWTPVATSQPAPNPRQGHTAVCCPDLHGIVVYGGARLLPPLSCGTCDEINFNDTWLLRTAGEPAWTDLTAHIAGTPPCGVQGHVAAYHRAEHRILLYGGLGRCTDASFVVQPAVWSLSVPDLRWSKLEPRGEEPRPRLYATAGFDVKRGQMLIHGGIASGQFEAPEMGDTWALTPDSSPLWGRVSPASATPPSSYGPDAIYDPIRDCILMYQRQEVWAYSFRGQNGWSRLTPDGEPPPPCAALIAVYDSSRDRMLLYGEYCVPGFPDVWALSLGARPAWSIVAAGEHPPVAIGGTGIHDPIRDRLIVINLDYSGGRESAMALELGAEPRWVMLEVSASVPPGRRGAKAIYDVARDRVVMFGGGISNIVFDLVVQNDTWALSLSEPLWKQVNEVRQSPELPRGRIDHSAVYDPVGDRMVVFGGYDPLDVALPLDTWGLDLSSGRWSELRSSADAKPDWYGQTAVYDSKRHRVVAVQGDHLWAMELGIPDRTQSGSGSTTLDENGPSTATMGRHLAQTLRSRPLDDGWIAEFSLPSAEPASLELFDLAGRRVWSADIARLGIGRHSVPVVPGGLPLGVYFLKLAHGGSSVTTRVVQVR